MLIQIGDLFFKTSAIFNGEKKGEDGNILTLTPIVQAELLMGDNLKLP